MSEYIADISSYRGANRAALSRPDTNVKDKTQLDMTDFLTLMVKEMTSQSIDSNMDTSEMLNQLVQMQMVQAMTNMTDASIMSYAASLVGKEVTVGEMDSNGMIQEHVGIVTGTGLMNGKQVVFVDDKYYFLSEIMAVGRLPAEPDPETPVDPDMSVDPNKPIKPDGSEKPVVPSPDVPEPPKPDAPVPPAPEMPFVPPAEDKVIPAMFDRPFAVHV